MATGTARVSDRVVGRLVDALGPTRVLTDPAVTAGHGRDWTGRFVGTADVVVAPATTEEVSATVAVCAETGTPVVPQGGNTGLVGGAVPDSGCVVVDLRRLDTVAVDPLARLATAGAGVTIQALHAAAGTAGLRYGVDLASRASATVGGTIATNAGGLRVVRHGDTRAQLIGVEAVLADGTVVSHLTGLTRDNTGYHLPSLLCGSEGTLALVTAAQVRLLPPRPNRSVALLAFETTAAAAAAASLLPSAPFVEAVELMRSPGVDLVCRVTGLPRPMREQHPVYLLVEAAAPDGVDDGLAEAVAGVAGVTDVAVGTDAASMARLWAYRERHTESIATLGPAHKLDVTLPASALAAFVDEVPARVAAAYPRARVWLFGHAADGAVHVNLTDVDPADLGVDELVLTMVAEAGGSISTEHGIGRSKRPWLHLSRSPAELRVFARLKAAFDPQGLLNPMLAPPVPA
jgi:FAD/FMN-containing dehydrogenase